MKKISILGGAGTLGATTAFVLAQKNLVDEICLIDIKGNIAASHKMDLEQAIAEFSNTKITSGDFSLLKGTDIVINTVGIPEKQVSSRMDYLEGNYKIIQQIADYLNLYTTNPIIITATNPLDIINSLLNHTVSIDPNRIIGFSLNDTFRVRWALSLVLNKPIKAIDAVVLGEHGEDQLPIYSHIYVEKNHITLTKEQKHHVQQIIKNWFAEYQSLNSGRTTGWLSSINLSRIVKAIVEDTKECIPCSVIGLDGISIGQPAVIGRNGVESIKEIPLTIDEQAQLIRIKEKITSVVDQLLQYQGNRL
ncbi:hypothetical protein F7731_20120 [Cytobacillus depressus]|uniref:Malate dehydrogenase n=1 Tax=Cytobacillus depressus TaxID=1602942 RepID=A0A6L3V053_9BACI|nr:hypothetical protein [Cytobacillus depressus]KAB2330481.1 hypothetical protein F7731_20120 [Cytobacillus depressus]